MNKLALKIGVGTFAAAAALVVFASSAFAATPTCTISGNGTLSSNKCVIVSKTSTKIVSVNKAVVFNGVGVFAATGGNEASGNTASNTTVTSGDVNVTTVIVNVVNSTVTVAPPEVPAT